MRRITRLALASACATGLAAPAIASALETTIRVEGSTATTIPQSPQDVAASGNTLVTDTIDGDTITVPSRSATAQLAAATGSRGLAHGFGIFNFGSGPTSFVNTIGPDATPSDFSKFWTFKVNHVTSSVGADSALLSSGDEVLWFFGPSGIDSELDVSGPSAPVEQGKGFTVSVKSYDGAGVSSPASGATVSYAGSASTTNSAGVASLTATGAGTQSIVVTAPNAVRDSATVCGYPAADPTVCGLAAPGTPASTAPAPRAVCRSVGGSSSGGGAGGTSLPTDATYRTIQWHARVTMQRVAAMNAWLDAGIEPGDICGGTFGQAPFVAGVTLAGGGPTDRASAPSPRTVALDPPAAPTAGTGATASASLAKTTRRISIEALKRTNALTARIRGGLTGGDLRPGAIGARQLAPGAQVRAAAPGAAGAPASVALATSPTRPAAFTPSRASATVDARIARAGLLRSSDLFQELRSGLGPDAFAPSSVGTASLSEGVRP